MAAEAGPLLTPRRAAGLMAALGLAGLAARLVNWPAVFAPWGVELVPADSHYYVRFAALQRAAFPRFQAFDDLLNFPRHTQVYWPGGHAWLVALAEWLAGAGREELGAAWVGPGLAALWWVIIAALASRFQRARHALWTLAVLALTPVAIESGALGNADHHVHEGFLIAAWALLTGAAIQRGSRRLALASGVLIGCARWLTTAAVLDVPLAAMVWVVLAVHQRVRAPGRAIASGMVGAAMTGAVLTVVAYALWHTVAAGLPLDFPGPYEVSDVFAALLAVAVGAGATGLVGAINREAPGRFVPWLLLGSVVLALVTPELARALRHLHVADPLLALVDESQPLWRDPAWAGQLLGPAALLVPGMVALLASPGKRPRPHHPALVAAGVLGALSLLQARFLQGWVGAAAVVAGPAIDRATLLLRPQWRRPTKWLAGGLAAALLVAQFQIPTAMPSLGARLKPTLTWLKEHTPTEPRASVLANYSFGHWILLWAERPALASTFSQAPGHVEANAAASDILAATDEERAYALARAQRVGWVLATPFGDILGHPEARTAPVLLRRLIGDEAPLPAFAHFRLVHQAAEPRKDRPAAPLARVYQLVEGARLRLACPGAAHALSCDDAEVEGHAAHFAEQRPCTPSRELQDLRLAQPGSWSIDGVRYRVTAAAVLQGLEVHPEE